MTRRIRGVMALALLCGVAQHAQGQFWNNRYPRVAGMRHHVYLEGYELPTLTNGPMDVAAAPDGKRLAFASRGWLWQFDVATGVAKRITTGSGMDSRPVWSPDGARIAFIRDDGSRLEIVIRELASGTESRIVTDSAIVLDPAFSSDGNTLFYSSAAQGDLDLYRIDIASRTITRLTRTNGTNELQPIPTSDGSALLYLAKTRGGADQVRRRSLDGTDDQLIASGSILSMMRGAISPDNRILALSWPTQEGYELRLVSAFKPGESVELLRDARVVPLAPAFSKDGRTLWYSAADAQQRMQLYRMSVDGGAAERVTVRTWDWGVPTSTLRVQTMLAGNATPVSARLALRTGDGHPIVPDSGQVRFDGQNGVPFFYTTGVATIIVPAGDVDITAVHGLSTPVATQRVRLGPGDTRTASLRLSKVWDARAHGWLSGEHHFHLNYGGPYHLEPSTLLAMGQAEDLDVLTPMLANLSQRFEDQALFGYRQLARRPWIIWSQEVRSHFLGHVGLINTDALFWPWIWGPGYDVHATDDRPNADVLAFAREHKGISTYVHPVSDPAPFASPRTLRGIPLGFVADAVQGRIDAIELSCLWSDSRGTAELWYRVLNVGVPLALNAGTDVMNNFYRTMAVGATRVFVRPGTPTDPASYFAALKAGRSFVSTGPMLDFRVGRAGPGDVIARGSGQHTWTLDVASAMPVDTIQIVVNGNVVETLPAFTAPGSKRYSGRVTLPAGGWVAARASGPPTRSWPGMGAYAYAHTSPVWIDRVGSTEPAARLAAARDLLRALDVADDAVAIGYSGVEHPRLLTHHAAARKVLDAWVAADGR